MSIESREEELATIEEQDKPGEDEFEKKPRKRREFKDAGKRVVLMAIELPKSVIQEQGFDPEVFEDPMTVWVPIGEPVEAANRKDAVAAVVGPEMQGRFRAPGAAAWRGEIRRRPPTAASIEVEEVD